MHVIVCHVVLAGLGLWPLEAERIVPMCEKLDTLKKEVVHLGESRLLILMLTRTGEPAEPGHSNQP